MPRPRNSGSSPTPSSSVTVYAPGSPPARRGTRRRTPCGGRTDQQRNGISPLTRKGRFREHVPARDTGRTASGIDGWASGLLECLAEVVQEPEVLLLDQQVPDADGDGDGPLHEPGRRQGGQAAVQGQTVQRR